MTPDILSASRKSEIRPMRSEDLAGLMGRFRWSSRPVTVVGYGFMGQEYVKALKSLKADRITVCSRSLEKLAPLKSDNIQTVGGGYTNMAGPVSSDAVAVVSTITAELAPCVRHLITLGYQTILCEKPVSLWSSEIRKLAEEGDKAGVRLLCAFNRIAYPAVIEARWRIAQDGGATSATYTFTELVHRINPKQFSEEELKRWGVANSIHVMNLAHGLIGFPEKWNGIRQGSWPWHPSGSLYVGAGTTEQGIPFNYHADWGSAGRWVVEVFTSKSAYRFCPLEKLQQKKMSLGEWEDVAISTFDSTLKTGIAEQLAALVDPEIEAAVGLLDLFQTERLTRFTEDIFGYQS